jgi:hypothetical protein
VRSAIPSSQTVNSALRQVAKRLSSVRKRINSSAAKEMKADHYEAAQKWMEMGSSVADFAQRLEAFAEEWKRLVKATRIVASVHAGNESARPAVTPATKRIPEQKS